VLSRMQSYVLSTLQAHARAMGPEEFRQRFPKAWLLWEPGEWKPPRDATEPALQALLTPGTAGEPLAFAVEPKPGAPAGEIDLGRGAECQLRVFDGTLSSRHLALREEEAGWRVKDVGSKNGSWLEGNKLLAQQWVPLASGARLIAGRVLLTFYLLPELLERLASVSGAGG